MSSANGPGRLAIVLHTHMPEVLGHGVWPFGEQWLWEAVAESYLRVADAVRGFPVTLGVTPVLAQQFDAMRGEPGDRWADWVDETREYVFGEDMRAFPSVGRDDLAEALAPQLADHREAVARFNDQLERDLVGLFKGLAADGAELISGPATHPVMPLLASDFGRQLQLARGLETHAELFAQNARGIWLPECAWVRGLDAALAQAGVDYFCVDQSKQHSAEALENMEPVVTPAGTLAFPIDWQMIHQVWDESGYPSADAYRSTFRRTTHDLMPYNNAGGAWNQVAARAQAEAHAEVFLRVLAARFEVFAADRGHSGLCVFAADTELFGHWWYEGPWWLEALVQRAEQYGIELVTLGTAADTTTPVERPLARSTWGKDKDFGTWDTTSTAELVWQQRRAELELEAALSGPAGARPQQPETAERELLLLQSSDWTFMESGDRTGDYGRRRFAEHLEAFRRALGS